MSSKPKNLIATFDYLRKSTKGEALDRKGRKKERQEKSISQQRQELDSVGIPHELKMAGYDGFDLTDTFTDIGVSGWKLGNERPGFQSMIDAIKQHPAREKLIRVDNMDRFSRADIDDTLEVGRELKKAGARWVLSVAQGLFEIPRGNDLLSFMKFAIMCNQSHEYSKQLSRRVSLAKRNLATQGKRGGGKAPYAMENDGEGGLKPGDPEKAKIVNRIFDQFANHARSLKWIAGDLNERQVPGPAGGQWYTFTVRGVVRRRCYRGDFTYNNKPIGRFFAIDEGGEVVDKAELIKEVLKREDGSKKVVYKSGKPFVKAGAYEPIVAPELFDKAQRRLDAISKDRSRRKRMGYALSGILICNHCGHAMYGMRGHGDKSAIVYRCSATGSLGLGTCGNCQVREDRILPFLMKMLGDEIKTLRMDLLTPPPGQLQAPHKVRQDKRQRLQKKRDELAVEIDLAVDNIMKVQDQRARQQMDERLTAMWNQLEKLDNELVVEPKVQSQSRQDIDALVKWWDQFNARAVSVPIGLGDVPPLVAMSYKDHFAEVQHGGPGGPAFLLDPRIVNDALHQLGAEVRLQWKTVEAVNSAGKPFKRHQLLGGRFRLGQNVARFWNVGCPQDSPATKVGCHRVNCSAFIRR